jgi:hypothetical protein
MKFLVAVTLALLALEPANALHIRGNHINGEEIAEIVEGFLEGAFEGSFPVKECIADAEDAIVDFENAYFAFKKGMTVTNVGQALTELGKAIKKIPAAIKDCKSCVGIIGKVETIAALFVNPARFLEKVGTNILWHFKDITGDIHQAKEDWETGNYKEFGMFCGKIVAVALGKVNPTSQVRFGINDAALFFEGFFEKISGPTGDITQCIETSEKLSVAIQSLAKEFEGSFGFDTAKRIAGDVKDILEIIPTEFATCSAVPKEALHIVEHWLSEFGNPVTAAEHILKALWSHHSELLDDAHTFSSAIGAREYYTAGESLADFIVIVLGHPN